MHATADAAIKAGVSIWTVDARGLVAQAPMGDATCRARPEARPWRFRWGLGAVTHHDGFQKWQ